MSAMANHLDAVFEGAQRYLDLANKSVNPNTREIAERISNSLAEVRGTRDDMLKGLAAVAELSRALDNVAALLEDLDSEGQVAWPDEPTKAYAMSAVQHAHDLVQKHAGASYSDAFAAEGGQAA
jgi:coenzyme F420-reducing hydrogenase alpha subunit